MRKSLLTLGLATLALSSFGATRILYQQNFESATVASETGWSYGGESMTIGSDAFGKYLELKQGQNNGRSAQLTWGQDIFMKNGELVLEDGTYNVTYDFCIAQGSNNQYNSEFTVFTNHAPIANNKYFLPWGQKDGNRCWENWLIDMNQNEADASPTQFYVNSSYTVTDVEVEDKEKDEEGNEIVVGTHWEKNYALDTNDATLASFTIGMWYTVSLDVNVNDRTVEYSIISLDGTEDWYGTRTVPENDVNGDPISMYAEGLFILVARYQTIYQIDNIKVSFESKFDNANPPTIALTGIGYIQDPDDPDKKTEDFSQRIYSISFLDGETLHVKGTDGVTVDVDYADCDGNYVYTTSKSGVLTAWTTSGNATSEEVTADVDCDPIVLPAANAVISTVTNGYGKTYTLVVDNTDVPLRPVIAMNYEFNGINGEHFAEEGVYSGAKLTVTEEGTLTITTEAYGFESKTVNVKNDSEFKETKTWDFARMSDEELKAAGFATWEILNSGSMSGFNNWTARKRLYYYDINDSHIDEESGETVYAQVLPFGFVSEDSPNVLEYCVISDNSDNTKYFDGLEIFDIDRHVGMLKHVGLYNDETANNNNVINIKNVSSNDFVLVNRIDDYGSNSTHPLCATTEEYIAQLAGTDEVLIAKNLVVEPDQKPNYKGSKERNYGSYSLLNEDGTYDLYCSLYRIDNALTKISIFSQINGGDNAVETINSVTGDGYYYSIDGIRVAEPTQPGLYIHNGKKIIVK